MYDRTVEGEYEYRVKIDGVYYGMDTLSDVHIVRPLFDKFDVGLACCAQMTVKYLFDLEPSRGCQLVAECRPKGSSEEWFQLGIFYIDLRTEKGPMKTLTCYDSMMKADVPYLRDEDTSVDVGEWPRSMKTVVDDIAHRMGVELDPRTVINPNYTVDYPNEDHMRTILQYVAAAHAGNWIVTRKDELLLVPLFSSMPPETHYLVTEYGYAIVFGEDRILI